MEIEILTLADFAKIYDNQLVINGPLNALKYQKLPQSRNIGFAMRARFEKDEPIFKELNIAVCTPSGNEDIMLKANAQLETGGDVDNYQVLSPSSLYALQLAVNFPLEFREQGLYQIKVSTSTGFSRKLPLMVIVEG